MTLPSAIAELAQRDQWVCWKFEERDGRATKVPCTPETGTLASSTNPGTWRTFAEAKAKRKDYSGLGFCFSPDDPYLGIDLDHAIKDGRVQDWALDIVTALDSYTEYSPSGTGLHIWVRARKPEGGCRRGDVEMYDRGRYFTVTGKPYHNAPIQDRQAEVNALHARLFPPEPERPKQTPTTTIAISDNEVLSKMLNSSSGPSIARLYNGDTSAYNGDDSAADLALCNHLAFWCGGDEAQVDRLFQSSALYRDKWRDKRGSTTYGQLTITKAISGATSFYDPNYRSAPANGNGNGHNPFAPKQEADMAEDPEPEPQRTKRYHVQTYEDLPTAPPVALVGEPGKPVLAVKAVTMLYGSPKGGKSFLAIDWGLSVATGTQWLDIPVQQGTVLYLYGEGRGGLRKRIDSWLEHHDMSGDDLKGRFFQLDISRPPLNLFDRNPEMAVQNVLNMVEDVLTDISDVSLIIIDTLSRVSLGANENAAGDMAVVMQAVAAMQTETDAAILLVHHGRKEKDENGGSSYRGSTVLHGAVDALYELIAEGGRDNRLTLRFDSAKDWETPDDMALRRINFGESCVICKEHSGFAANIFPGKAAEVLRMIVQWADEGLTVSNIASQMTTDEAKYLSVRRAVERACLWLEKPNVRGRYLDPYIATKGLVAMGGRNRRLVPTDAGFLAASRLDEEEL